MIFKDIQIIYFDADDTLWENHTLFLDLIMMVIDLIRPFTDKTPKELEKEFYFIQGKYLKRYGYGLINFLPPLITLLGRYYPLPPFPDKLRNAIKEFRTQMLYKSPPLIPGIEKLVQTLTDNDYALHLLTKGNISEQLKKLRNADIVHHFNLIQIVAEKSVGTYRGIAGELGLVPEKLLMVGNSLKSDVYPALQAGWNAVRFKREHDWYFEESDQECEKEYIEVHDLNDIPGLLGIE